MKAGLLSIFFLLISISAQAYKASDEMPLTALDLTVYALNIANLVDSSEINEFSSKLPNTIYVDTAVLKQDKIAAGVKKIETEEVYIFARQFGITDKLNIIFRWGKLKRSKEHLRKKEKEASWFSDPNRLIRD